jgi:hypothetical protein
MFSSQGLVRISDAMRWAFSSSQADGITKFLAFVLLNWPGVETANRAGERDTCPAL